MRFSLSSSRLVRVLFLGGAAAAVATAVACTSSDGGKACADSPATVDTSGAQISFTADVYPVFQQSCTFSDCHATALNGVSLKADDAGVVYANIVGVKAPENQSMAFVAAGQPHESYLMRKMDGSQCLLTSTCTHGDCGVSMPKDDAVLDTSIREKVRKWIGQGAQQN